MSIRTVLEDASALLSPSSFWQPEYLVESAWHEHAPFLSWLIAALRPGSFVELGCHHGFSYFAACQTVKRLGLLTSCFAIDSWEGDEQAGFYGQEVFTAVAAHNAAHYAEFSQLIRAYFIDALPLFADSSINVLHIDGRHFYEDVLEDYENWLPKLAPDGIVLLHDTAEKHDGFGVWRLFAELQRVRPTFEFYHGHGLGIVAVGSIPPSLEPLFDKSYALDDFARLAYSTLGASVSRRWQLLEAANREASLCQLVDDIEPIRQSAAELRSKLDASVAAQAQTEAELRSALDASVEAQAETVAELRAALDASVSAHRLLERDLASEQEAVHRLARLHDDTSRQLSDARAEIERLVEERTRLLNSASWRLTAGLRRVFERYPKSTRAAWWLANVARWIVTLRLNRIAEAFLGRWRLWRQVRIISHDPMFDPNYYRSHFMVGAETRWSPAEHYVLIGRFNDCDPHALFDLSWYSAECPDARANGQDPLVHYIRHGRAEHRRPNPFLDPGWYLRTYPDVAAAGVDPVQHYLTVGAAEGLDPSPYFKTRHYLDSYPDVAASGINPLVHYLEWGRDEGRSSGAWDPGLGTARAVTAAEIECRKKPQGGGEAALFVTHSADGRLKPHVPHYLRALANEGIKVTLIVAADRGFTGDEAWLYECVDGLYVRGNEGWDFAAWAHVLRMNRALFTCDIVYWVNDSIVGPVSQEAFHAVIERIRSSPAALVGLTDNHERGQHLQSYFLAIKKECLGSALFQRFVLDVQSLHKKQDVIDAYEVRFSARMEAAGLETSALFVSNGQLNATLLDWKSLLDRGFPFLKMALIVGRPPGADTSGWRKALTSRGYDGAILDQLVTPRDALPAPVTDGLALRHVNEVAQVTFIGPYNYANGLGVAARGYVSALMHSGLEANLLPIERPFHIHRRVTPTCAAIEFVGPADVAVVHLNPEAWPSLLTPAQQEAISRARFRIGAFVWESQTLPEFFQAPLRELDRVWAASRYCARAFEAIAGSRVDVVHYPVAVPSRSIDPARARQTKRALGVTESTRLVLFSFDATSYLSRKNPMALLRAFKRTRLFELGWCLVLKTKHLREAGEEGRALLEAVKDSPGVILVDRPTNADAMRALLEAADVYASPHASEGFGLTIAESMALGKLVMATDFGGSTDFLNATCGFPIRCDEWLLDDPTGPYPAGTLWGRIDEDHLAERLEQAAQLEPEEREAIGDCARQRIETMLSPAAIARTIRASIERTLST